MKIVSNSFVVLHKKKNGLLCIFHENRFFFFVFGKSVEMLEKMIYNVNIKKYRRLFMENYVSPEIKLYSVLATDVISASVVYDANETEEDRFVSA